MTIERRAYNYNATKLVYTGTPEKGPVSSEQNAKHCHARDCQKELCATRREVA